MSTEVESLNMLIVGFYSWFCRNMNLLMVLSSLQFPLMILSLRLFLKLFLMFLKSFERKFLNVGSFLGVFVLFAMVFFTGEPIDFSFFLGFRDGEDLL